MKFDQNIDTIVLSPQLCLSPGMTRKEILAMSDNWEEWVVNDGVPVAFRTVMSLPQNGKYTKIVLIVYVGTEERPIAFWNLGVWDLMDGKQNRPNRKYTKRMRNWFNETFGVKLPLGREWGHIDASYDGWNQSTTIVCNYRERFGTEQEWQNFRKLNRF